VRDLGRPQASGRCSPPPLGLGGTLLLCGGAALLLFAATHAVIPVLVRTTGVEPVLLWFASAGLGVFAPLLLLGLLLLRREGSVAKRGLWRDRLRFGPMTAGDWAWSIAGVGLVGLFSLGTLALLRRMWGDVPLHPSFMTMEPLTPGRYWILAAWLPFWVLNVVGEEVFWRGVVLPLQEEAFGNWAWFVNGAGWLLFHAAFGATIMLTLWPIIFILPWMVQQRRNSWIGVVIHAAVNGPGFVAVAFGLV